MSDTFNGSLGGDVVESLRFPATNPVDPAEVVSWRGATVERVEGLTGVFEVTLSSITQIDPDMRTVHVTQKLPAQGPLAFACELAGAFETDQKLRVAALSLGGDFSDATGMFITVTVKRVTGKPNP